MSQLLLGFDFGGTKVAVGIGPIGGDELAVRRTIRVPPAATMEMVYSNAIRAAEELLSTISGSVAGVGVSFGGHVDVNRGLILRSLHVPGWEDFPIRDRLSSQFHAPVDMENDANAGALGEWTSGAGRSASSMLYITVSTGVGGAWVLNHRIFRGSDGMAGEIGHIMIDPTGPNCTCGKRGCLEAMASGQSIARRAQEVTGQPWTADQVAREASASTAWAHEILLEAATHLGTGIGNAACLMNPQIVVLGGGVSKAGPDYWHAVRRSAAGRILPGVSLDIVPAEHVDDAPLRGALMLADQMASHPRVGTA